MSPFLKFMVICIAALTTSVANAEVNSAEEVDGVLHKALQGMSILSLRPGNRVVFQQIRRDLETGRESVESETQSRVQALDKIDVGYEIQIEETVKQPISNTTTSRMIFVKVNDQGEVLPGSNGLPLAAVFMPRQDRVVYDNLINQPVSILVPARVQSRLGCSSTESCFHLKSENISYDFAIYPGGNGKPSHHHNEFVVNTSVPYLARFLSHCTSHFEAFEENCQIVVDYE